MKVELLYFDGCLGHRKAGRALRSALSGSGVHTEFEKVTVSTDEETERLRFPCSPTVHVDGEDLFPEDLGPRTGWYLGCRIYRTPEGLKDYPPEEMIRGRSTWRKEGRSDEKR